MKSLGLGPQGAMISKQIGGVIRMYPCVCVGRCLGVVMSCLSLTSGMDFRRFEA